MEGVFFGKKKQRLEPRKSSMHDKVLFIHISQLHVNMRINYNIEYQMWNKL